MPLAEALCLVRCGRARLGSQFVKMRPEQPDRLEQPRESRISTGIDLCSGWAASTTAPAEFAVRRSPSSASRSAGVPRRSTLSLRPGALRARSRCRQPAGGRGRADRDSPACGKGWSPIPSPAALRRVRRWLGYRNSGACAFPVAAATISARTSRRTRPCQRIDDMKPGDAHQALVKNRLFAASSRLLDAQSVHTSRTMRRPNVYAAGTDAAQERSPQRRSGEQRDASDRTGVAAMIAARQDRLSEAQQLIEPVLKFHRELLARNSDDRSQHLQLAHGALRRRARVAESGRSAAQLAEAAALIDGLPPAMRRLISINCGATHRRGTERPQQVRLPRQVGRRHRVITRPASRTTANRGTTLSDTATTIREALDAGLNAQALDLARDATAESAPAAEIRYLGALASARLGAIGEAEKWLAKSIPNRLATARSPSRYGASQAALPRNTMPTSRDRTSATARGSYARAPLTSINALSYLGGTAYPAVNAATMAMLSGDLPACPRHARQALAALGTVGDHWHHATAGEALLILDRLDEARAAIRRSISIGRQPVWRCRVDAAATSDDRVGRRRAVGRSAACPAGHRVLGAHDRSPGPALRRGFRRVSRRGLPTALYEKIENLGLSVGYAQAACGADILFLEAMQNAGMQTQIVLPFAPIAIHRSERELCRRSLDTALRTRHGARDASRPRDGGGFLGDDVLFEHAANLIQGMAFLRARELSTHPLMLTVHEPGTPELVGGTAATARNWARKGGRIDNIDLAALRGGTSAQRHESPAIPAPSARSRRLQSLLFADISGYTRMPEQYTPDFAEMFLGNCKRILDSLEHPAVDVNTLGDGLFAVFDMPSHAAEFALRLQQALNKVDWPALGLSEETGPGLACIPVPSSAFSMRSGRERPFTGLTSTVRRDSSRSSSRATSSSPRSSPHRWSPRTRIASSATTSAR